MATMMAQEATCCHVDGLKMASKHSTNWPKRFTKTARKMVRNSTRLSRMHWRKKWPGSTNKTGKRKRSNIDTYDDLNDGAFIMKDAKSCDEDEEEDEQWVAKNVFIV